MDGRDRCRRVLAREGADRPPYWELMGFQPATIARWQAEGLPADVHLEVYFRLDRMEWVPIDDRLVPPFAEEVVKYQDGAPVRRDAAGRIYRERAGGVIEYVSWPLVTKSDFAGLKTRLNPASPRRYPAHWSDYVRSVKDRDYPLGVSVRGPLGRLVDLAGPSWTVALASEEPVFFRSALDDLTAFLVDLVRPALAGVNDLDLLVIRESLCGKALTAEAFREWFAPGYGRLAGVAADYGVRNVLLVCPGDVRPAVEAMAEAGITALGPLSAEAGVDPLEVRRRTGGALALVGGIDTRALTGDRAAVEREVRSKAPALLAAGGWVPSLDAPVPPAVPLDNYRFYWELVRDLAEAGR